MKAKKDFSIINVDANGSQEVGSSALFEKSRSLQSLLVLDARTNVPAEDQQFIQKQSSSSLACQKRSLNISCHKSLNMKVLKQGVLKFCLRWNQISLSFIFGVIVGVTLTTSLFQHNFFYSTSLLSSSPEEELGLNVDDVTKMYEQSRTKIFTTPELPFTTLENKQMNVIFENESTFQTRFSRKTRIFVGVITAEKYLGSRATAVNNTWGSQVDDIEFFTQRGSRDRFHIPVVNLEKVSDTEYPPQKKAFEILKYMCTNHLNDFEWFIRADDDVYIRVERLRAFLSSFDSDSMVYMGQAGSGLPEVKDTLGLKGHNFCMGGPGVIFSRRTLEALCPHIDSCMEEVVTAEEDVEIGRCVTNHLNIECTHAWETFKVFYHAYQEDYEEEKPFLGNLMGNKHVEDAMTLHFLKDPTIMHRVHRHYSNQFANETAQRILEIEQSMKLVKFKMDSKTSRTVTRAHLQQFNRSFQTDSWESFNTDYVFSLSPSNVIKNITNDVLEDLKQIGESAVDDAIRSSESSEFIFSHVIDGYLRSDFSRGTDYFVNIYFKNEKPELLHQEKRVHLFRPSGSLNLASINLIKLNDRQKNFLAIATTRHDEAEELAASIRSFFDLFPPKSKSLAHFLVVAIETKDDKLRNHFESIDDVIKRHLESHPEENLLYLPGFNNASEGRYLTIDSAFAHSVLHAGKLLDDAQTIVLLTSTQLTLTFELLENCKTMTGLMPRGKNLNESNFPENEQFGPSQQKQLYQPLPFEVYFDSVNSTVPLPTNSNTTDNFRHLLEIWNAENEYLLPLCGRLGDFTTIASSALNADKTFLRFRKTVYDNIYEEKLKLFRSPGKVYLNLPGR